jgi:hypothetical protein
MNALIEVLESLVHYPRVEIVVVFGLAALIPGLVSPVSARVTPSRRSLEVSASGPSRCGRSLSRP